MKKVPKLKIKNGDTVTVICGDDKGKTGTVLDIDPNAMRVQVQGVRIQTKRNKRENTLFKEEGYIHYSNIAIVSGAQKKAKKKATKSKAKKTAEVTA